MSKKIKVKNLKRQTALPEAVQAFYNFIQRFCTTAFTADDERWASFG